MTNLCPDCAAAVGEPHTLLCDVLPATQRLEPEAKGTWTGEWPGVRECRERGWFARMGANGWEPCAPDEGMEDLNRLTAFKISGADTLYSS